MKLFSTFLIFCLLTIANSCGQSSNQSSSQTQEKSKEIDKTQKTESTKSKPEKDEHYLKLIKHVIMDREGTGMVAFNCLIPEGWTVNDKLYWEYNDATLPIRYQGVFEDPKNNLRINSYPDIRSVFSTGPTGTSGYPAPRGLIPGLKDLIKKERRGIQYKVVEEKIIKSPAPQTGYQQGSYLESRSQTGFVRIEYEENAQPVEEAFYGQLDVTNMNSQGVVTYNSAIWSANNLYSVKAPNGKLEAVNKIALTIRASSKPTLPFYNKFIQVTKLLSDAVYAKIYQAGQISKIISQTNDQISKTISDSYWQTQKSNEHINNQFSDYIRGVDRYSDGSQTQIQLPSGYSNAWVNDRGEYIMAESNGFDPNTSLNGNWKQLEKK